MMADRKEAATTPSRHSSRLAADLLFARVSRRHPPCDELADEENSYNWAGREWPGGSYTFTLEPQAIDAPLVSIGLAMRTGGPRLPYASFL
jgi:hypothetical protein